MSISVLLSKTISANVYVAMYLFPPLMYFHKNVKKCVSKHCGFNKISYFCTRNLKQECTNRCISDTIPPKFFT